MRIGENILIICTYEELGQIYRHVLKEYDLSIDLKVMDNRYGKDMDKVLSYIDSFRKEGKEIIITRGFLADKIRRHLNYQVIEINITGLDVLRTLYPYIGQNILIGIVECRAFLDVVAPVAQQLGLRVNTYEVQELEDFDKGIAMALDDGVDVIVGGGWAEYSRENGSWGSTTYLAIESSEESIKSSLNNAMSIYSLTYAERKQKELLETVVDFSDSGLLAVDENLRILIVNTYARTLFGLGAESREGEALPDSPIRQLLMKTMSEQKSTLSNLMQLGAQMFLMNAVPIRVAEDVVGAVVTAKRMEDVREDEKLIRQELVRKGLSTKYDLSSIQGRSKRITDLKKLAAIYAETDATVLILGESGTGKELFAQAIHSCSQRKNSPFVALNCSTLPPSLLESELFGYVDGAFTGARKGGKVGLFEMAHRGTIFLDEIGEMDLGMQARLLRVIQEKEVMRIGDNKVISVDVRIVAATNKDLYHEVEKGSFREDLYYRLNILNLHIPPLRERKEDIEDIAIANIPKINRRLNCHIRSLETKVIRKLADYEWKGNIRELINVLERMAVVTRYGVVKYSQVEFIFRDLDKKRPDIKQESDLPQMTLREMERRMIENAIKAEHGNKTKAAALLGIDRTTLARKMSKFDDAEYCGE